MSLSDWRKGVVDLTADSDDEDKGQSSSTAPRSLPWPIVPLPSSKHPPQAVFPLTTQSVNQVPRPSSTPRLPQTSTAATTINIPVTNALSTLNTSHTIYANYIPLASSTRNGSSNTWDSDHAQKRRRVTVQEEGTHANGGVVGFSSGLSASGILNVQGNSVDLRAHHTGRNGVQAQQQVPSALPHETAFNGLASTSPSVHYMNVAPGANGTPSPIAQSMIGDGPGSFPIRRYSGESVIPKITEHTPPSLSNISTPSHGPGLQYRSEMRNLDTRPTQQQGTQFLGRNTSSRRSLDKGIHISDVPPSAPGSMLTVQPGASWGAPNKQKPHPSGSQKSLKKMPASLSEEEEHLLIFLKEVKGFNWKKITEEFQKYFPSRSYTTIQSRYSTKVNKRPRSLDPQVLKLPPEWAAEAAIDWKTVHAEHPGPKESTDMAKSYLAEMRASRDVPNPHDNLQTVEGDYSSGNDSGLRQHRPRRAPPVNYDVCKRTREIGLDVAEIETLDDGPILNVDLDDSSRETTPEGHMDVPTVAIAVENDPIDVTFTSQDTILTLAARKHTSVAVQLPYLSSIQRLAIRHPQHDWFWDQVSSRRRQGDVIHVDFSPEELKVVEHIASNVAGTLPLSQHTTYRRHFRSILKQVSESKLREVLHEVRRRLPSRSSDSISAFLEDARLGKLSDTPRIQRIAAARMPKDMASTYKTSTNTLVRQRELGTQARRGWRAASIPLTYQVKNKMMDTLGPAQSWTGASSDIHTVAWSQDGGFFAAGAVAVTDPDSMQYNRPNNLLFGSALDNTIHELAEHNIKREKTETGADSSHAMFVSQDRNLYTTVTAVAFSPSGELMFSAGYDKSVCIWHLDPFSRRPNLCVKLGHKAEVEMMVVNPRFDGMVATAAKRSSSSAIKLLTFDEDKLLDPSAEDPTQFQKHDFHSAKAASRSDLNILPQALRFEPMYGRLLLAGFGANVREDSGFDITGDLCLWDVESRAPILIHGSNRNVFDVAFNPNRRYMPSFAAACVASTNVNRGTRSVVRLYDERTADKYTCPVEIECRALDINDIVWCPHDEHLIAAGCTDGRVYVWDIRHSDDPIRTLSHGLSLMPLQDDVPHERTDTGVRFLSWGDNATRLYSGSSDGVVKTWDVTRSLEDTFIKDIITTDSGIMAGSFSPDYTRLLIGEVSGSVNVLEVGRDDCSSKDAEKMSYYSHRDDMLEEELGSLNNEDASTKSGVAEGKYLLHSQQLQVAPMGKLPIRQVVQGPNYQGPFDHSVDARLMREEAMLFQLSMAAIPGPQCDIPTCKDNVVKVTSEEIGDSKRSADRIPDELRRQWKAIDQKLGIMPGRTKCSKCGRSARPSWSDEASCSPSCERCSFSCFRCGSPIDIPPTNSELVCCGCNGVWDVDVLGYECTTEPSHPGIYPDVPSLRRFGREMLEERFEEQNTTFGDDMNALTDYYFSLAIDRPESPPL